MHIKIGDLYKTGCGCIIEVNKSSRTSIYGKVLKFSEKCKYDGLSDKDYSSTRTNFIEKSKKLKKEELFVELI